MDPETLGERAFDAVMRDAKDLKTGTPIAR